MIRISLLFLLLAASVAMAREPVPGVAVYMAGREPDNAMGAHRIVGSELARALTNSGAYSADDRTESIRRFVGKKRARQRIDEVDGKQIRSLGKHFGVAYLCVADVSEVAGGSYFLEARFIDVESAQTVKSARTAGVFGGGGTFVKEMESAAVALARGVITGMSDDELAKNAAEHNGRGLAHSADADKAIEAFSEAIRLMPDTAEYYYNRGTAHQRKLDYDKAIADYTDAIRLKPGDARYYDGRGFVYRLREEYDKAIADYAETIRLAPNAAIYRFKIASIFYDRQNYDRAIINYNEAIRLDPSDAAYRGSRANAYFLKKEYDKAIADYTEAIRLAPASPEYYSNRGNTHYEKSDFDKSIADHTQAIRLRPMEWRYYNDRGRAYFYKGDRDSAEADSERANKLRKGKTGL